MEEMLKTILEEVRGTKEELHNEMQNMRQELHEEIQDVKKGLQEEIQDVKKGLQEEIQDVKKGLQEEMQDMKKGLQEEMQDMKKGLQEEMQDVKKGLQEEMQKMKKELKEDILLEVDKKIEQQTVEIADAIRDVEIFLEKRDNQLKETVNESLKIQKEMLEEIKQIKITQNEHECRISKLEIEQESTYKSKRLDKLQKIS